MIDVLVSALPEVLGRMVQAGLTFFVVSCSLQPTVVGKPYAKGPGPATKHKKALMKWKLLLNLQFSQNTSILLKVARTYLKLELILCNIDIK